MRKSGWLRGLKFAALAGVAVAAGAALGAVVMGLWNWLLPDLFGWHVIGFWQALGLLVLSKILLGSLHGGFGHHRMHWRARMHERWGQMSDEERQAFRDGMRRRCGHSDAAPEPHA